MNIAPIASSGPEGLNNRQQGQYGLARMNNTNSHALEPNIAVESKSNETRDTLREVSTNTRFSYSINEKTDSFVVKIIDMNTDKVVKEIPSRELQKLHENLQEAIGIFLDRMA